MKKVVFLFHENDATIPGERSPAMTWWYGILENMGYEVAYYDYVNFNFDAFYNEIKEYGPDFIIHAAYDQVHTEFVKLREIAKTFVIQSDDDYRFYNFGIYWIPFVDGIISFCGGRETMKQMYYQAGATEESFLHGYWSFNPNTMMLDGRQENKTLISHAGSIYGTRQGLINQFKEKRGWDVDVIKNVKYDEFKKRVASSAYSLCFTQASADPKIRQLKGRIFELPYHSILLSEPFPDMEQYYDLGEEIIVFNSVDDAIESILQNDVFTKSIKEKGKKRLLSNHTAYHVWDKYILPKMDPDYVPKNIAVLLKQCHNIVI